MARSRLVHDPRSLSNRDLARLRQQGRRPFFRDDEKNKKGTRSIKEERLFFASQVPYPYDGGQQTLTRCGDVSFFSVETPVTNPCGMSLILRFVPTEGHGTIRMSVVWPPPHLHQTPVVRLIWRLRFRQFVFPLADLVSNFAPITRTVFGVGPRFECLQTKRCALLWSVSYPCSIFHYPEFASKFVQVPLGRNFQRNCCRGCSLNSIFDVG